MKEHEAWRLVGTPRFGGILVVSDHASNQVPDDIDLGIDPALLNQHIAVDIGVREIGELMAHDALDREESCGGHFRTEHQTPEGEALRHDDKFSYVSCWEYQGEDKEPVMMKEPLDYEFIVRQQRNYKS